MSTAEFPELVAAARESGIGRGIAWLLRASRRAAGDAIVARAITEKARRIRAEAPEVRVRWVSATFAIAAVIALVLSWMVPPYLRTLIPAYGFLTAAVLFGAATASPHIVLRHWHGSAAHRFMNWLRG